MDSNKFALFALRKDVCDPFVLLAMKASLTHGSVYGDESWSSWGSRTMSFPMIVGLMWQTAKFNKQTQNFIDHCIEFDK
ncbi:hypothetical protein [Bifidobacterium moukalabense]|uniref:hypothetical protein n=1 Tax=Bifidobacterium moukalabense TaxID=1333651 RepID=UPI00142F1E05|nr:hypothetical protein [Bifidobacterium moukalabense]